jgi:hypothetical protein
MGKEGETELGGFASNETPDILAFLLTTVLNWGLKSPQRAWPADGCVIAPDARRVVWLSAGLGMTSLSTSLSDRDLISTSGHVSDAIICMDCMIES